MSNLWRQDRAGAATAVGSFATWAKPEPFRPWATTDGPEPEDAEALKPVTDEIVAADIDAFAEGFEAGRRAAEEALQQEREALADFAASLEALRPEPTEALTALLAETIDRLVRQIVGEVEIDAALMMRRIDRAVSLIGDETAPSRLRLHPADIQFIDPLRIAVPVVPDGTLTRGTIVLETSTGWIEDGPQVRLERLRAELDRMGPGDE